MSQAIMSDCKFKTAQQKNHGGKSEFIRELQNAVELIQLKNILCKSAKASFATILRLSSLLVAICSPSTAIGQSIPAVINLSGLDGSNGFVINGIDDEDVSGWSVSDAGDVNGDGVDDLIIGARWADANGNNNAGESYVVFGGIGVGSSGAINLSALNGSNGYVINGIDADDLAGRSVGAAGDINVDGVDDLIIGAPRWIDPSNETGESYVVFGGNGVGSSGSLDLSTLTGSNGFVINGVSPGEQSGHSVTGAGDVNSDGKGDLIIGVYDATNNDAGKSYVLFGGSGVGASGAVNLSALTGSNGFVINGIDQNDNAGRSVSGAGDINADGVDDLIIGAYDADPNGTTDAGESYVVFGINPTPLCNGLSVTVNLNLGQATTPGDDVVMGTDGVDDIRGKAGTTRYVGWEEMTLSMATAEMTG